MIGKGVTDLSIITGYSNPYILAALAATTATPYIYRLWKKIKNRKSNDNK
jgi:hypothetical protein